MWRARRRRARPRGRRAPGEQTGAGSAGVVADPDQGSSARAPPSKRRRPQPGPPERDRAVARASTRGFSHVALRPNQLAEPGHAYWAQCSEAVLKVISRLARRCGLLLGRGTALSRRSTVVSVDDDAIRSLVTRLARVHPSGGTVIERAAIVAQGADFEAVMTWIVAHGGKPEAGVDIEPTRLARIAASRQRRVQTSGSVPLRAPRRRARLIPRRTRALPLSQRQQSDALAGATAHRAHGDRRPTTPIRDTPRCRPCPANARWDEEHQSSCAPAIAERERDEEPGQRESPRRGRSGGPRRRLSAEPWIPRADDDATVLQIHTQPRNAAVS